MTQKLKEFVSKFVQKESKANFPYLYIVDKQTGPYRRIQDAIDAAQPNSLIKVSEGFYEQNLIITKPLKIQPKKVKQGTNNMGVVLLVESGIGIRIKLPFSYNQVSITGLKISHTGSSTKLQIQLIQHQHILNIFQDHEKEVDQLEHEFINRISFNKIENMIIFVEVGTVNLSLCVFSLKFLVKSCKNMIPGICIQKQGILNMSDSEIKGNQEKDTAGILCKLGVLNLKNSVITDHKLGGAVIWGINQNPSKLIKNRIQRNSIGIHLLGQKFKLKVCQNQICKNITGIKVGLACQVQISRNYICQNINGIQVHSSFPLIYLNKIDNNTQNGIITQTYKKMICIAKIRKNISISGNKQYGIMVLGQNNRTKIIQNYLISFNLQSGIKISKCSFPLILKNKIYKNFNEGILITEDANATIQKNFISHNFQCNIALGGAISHNTLVVENKISNSPGPGIIIAQGTPTIVRNDIVENMQGLQLINSGGRIRRNYIAKNQNDGMVCQGQCFPVLVQNLITRNGSIGLFMRSQEGLSNDSVIFSNIIVSNEINVGLEFKNEATTNSLKASNTIEGTILQPQTVSCAIM